MPKKKFFIERADRSSLPKERQAILEHADYVRTLAFQPADSTRELEQYIADNPDYYYSVIRREIARSWHINQMNERIHDGSFPIILARTVYPATRHGEQCVHCSRTMEVATTSFIGAQDRSAVSVRINDKDLADPLIEINAPDGGVLVAEMGAMALHAMDAHPATDSALLAAQALTGLYEFTRP